MATPVLSKMPMLRPSLSAPRTQKLVSTLQSSLMSSTRNSHSATKSCLEQCTAIRTGQCSLWRPSRQPAQSLQPQRRSQSTTPFISATQIRTAASKTTPITSDATPSSQVLTWNEFLVARRRKRFFTTGFSIVFAITAAIIGAPLIGEFGIDAKISEAFGGADPILVLAGSSVTIAVAGWFAGRVLGAQIFQLWAAQRGWARIYAEKETSLLNRIKRYRADPASSSPQNPVPDYYGEKIASVANYRAWLKDQRAFTKKMYRGVRP